MPLTFLHSCLPRVVVDMLTTPIIFSWQLICLKIVASIESMINKRWMKLLVDGRERVICTAQVAK